MDRDALRTILLAYGIPNMIVDLISLLYTNTSAQVITPDGKTEFFEILAVVLQGDTLAPYLFIIVMHYCMRIALEKHPDLDTSEEWESEGQEYIGHRVCR